MNTVTALNSPPLLKKYHIKARDTESGLVTIFSFNDIDSTKAMVKFLENTGHQVTTNQPTN